MRAAIGDGDLTGYAPVQDGLWAKEVPGPEGDRLIVCHSAERAAEEQTWRAELIADSEADLARLQRRARQLSRDALVAAATQILHSSYGYRYLWTEVAADGALSYGRQEAALAEERARDGKFVLRTNDAGLAVAEAALAYKQLQRVERGFRELKDFLKLRPVRHFRPDRVEAHVAVCVLAYLLEMVLEHKLARAGLPMTAQANQDIRVRMAVSVESDQLHSQRVLERQRVVVKGEED
ncbi:MAG: transposase [Actinobacteria bacterium]|nr:transposase [Actinomycetota bacterium]